MLQKRKQLIHIRNWKVKLKYIMYLQWISSLPKWDCLSNYSLSSDVSRIVDIVVSDAIATKKKVFIHGSPLAWQKKGLGEGSLPARMYRAQRRIVVQCNAGGYSHVFCKSGLTCGKSGPYDSYWGGIAVFFIDATISSSKEVNNLLKRERKRKAERKKKK